MIIRISRPISTLLLSLVIVLSGFAVGTPKVSAAFDANNIMSDSVFENTGTMSPTDIDNLLNRYPSSCISPNSGFRTPDPKGWSNANQRYEFGGNVTAGQAIYSSAQFYHVNPQVLLATLQKEQSTVTGGAGCFNEPDPNNNFPCDLYNNGRTYTCTDACHHLGGCMNIAMGNQCPYYCDARYEGFSMQIITGAWTLRFGQQRSLGHVSGYPGFDIGDDGFDYGGPMVKGFRQRNKNEPATNWDGLYSPIDGGSVTITSGATAALYRYTPFKSGNSHFVDIFENTFKFGSTLDGRLTIAHPDGTLVRPANSPRVYLLVNSKASYGTSMAVLQSWGYNLDRLKIGTAEDVNLMAATDADTAHTNNPAPLQFRPATLIKGSGPTVYIVEYDSNGVITKHSLDSLENFNRLGYTFGDVISVSDSELPTQTGAPITTASPTHPNFSLVRDAGSPTVYYIINGERHSMTSLEIFLSHGFKFSSVKTSTDGDKQLPISWPVTWYREGTLVKGSGPTVYIIDLDTSGVNMNKRSFVTYYNFVGLDYRFNEVVTVPDSSLPASNGPNIGD